MPALLTLLTASAESIEPLEGGLAMLRAA